MACAARLACLAILPLLQLSELLRIARLLLGTLAQALHCLIHRSPGWRRGAAEDLHCSRRGTLLLLLLLLVQLLLRCRQMRLGSKLQGMTGPLRRRALPSIANLLLLLLLLLLHRQAALQCQSWLYDYEHPKDD